VLEIDAHFEGRRKQLMDNQARVLREHIQTNRSTIPANHISNIELVAQTFAADPPSALRELADVIDDELIAGVDAASHEGRGWPYRLKRVVDKLDKEWRHLNADWDRRIAQENQLAESRLIAIGTGLDSLGQGAIGGIHYRINRSRYFSKMYRTLTKTLRVELIETWTSYTQFLTRGLDPAFKFIDGVGTRLASLRERLHGEMQSIQTSAIVNQTEATRDNTVQLENVLREVRQLVFVAEQLTVRAQAEQRWYSRLVNDLRIKLLKMQIRTAFFGAVAGTAIVAAGKLLFEYFKDNGWPF
jgi:hypothetical protein